jgi:dihydroorotate dehydrogenase (fumarate)
MKLLEQAKGAVDVPIIPSLNCVSDRRWADYARQLESAGADAIELNVGRMPCHTNEEGAAIEDLYYRILHQVKSRVAIPVAMKVGPYFSGFANFAVRLTTDRAEAPDFSVGWFGRDTATGKIVWEGADALVLFNRYYQFDIDIEKMALVAGNSFSSAAEMHTSLRWISLLAGKIPCDLAANTGIHDSRDVIKQLLAGATVVQICSTLYRNGFDQIGKILEELRSWMERHAFTTIDEFRGSLSHLRSDHPENYERLQYIKVLGGGEK